MKKKRKLIKTFFSILYCCALSIPLFTLVYHMITNIGHGLQDSAIEQIAQGASHPTGYTDFSTKSFNNACWYSWYDLDIWGTDSDDTKYTNGHTLSQYYSGFSYSDIYSDIGGDDMFSEMLFRVDYLSLMNFNAMNRFDNVGCWLFLNYYINYVINMSLILFMPEILMLFIQWCRDLVYTFTEKQERSF